jgi:NDP-sugar pyrophosphorylase family protein
LYAPQPADMNGTWAALYGAKDFIHSDELFCVMNCDDLFHTEELEKVLNTGIPGMGITKTSMPAKYHGIRAKNGFVTEFQRHTDMEKDFYVEDTFANGFFLLSSKVFSFSPVVLSDKELGLPQTLLAYSATYPLAAHEIHYWQPCNSIEDLEYIKENH